MTMVTNPDTGSTPAAVRKPVAPATCGGCDATWTAAGACHCAAAGCHQTFAGRQLFDAHRTARGDHGTCLDPTTVKGCEWRDGMWRGPEAPPELRQRWAAVNDGIIPHVGYGRP